ncbi:MAG: 23S rRNA pseudouridine(2605) synthase RluB [Pseudomonadota bacterium]
MSGQRQARPSGEKLHKVLARAGFGSRRQLEKWISAGRVSVNGQIARLGDSVTPNDLVRVDGHPLGTHALRPLRTRVLLYHKPAGEICARHDPEGRRTVFSALPGVRNGRWVMVGRLDVGTSGLLLFTNNGELANRLMHPSGGFEREYAVRVLGQPDRAALAALTGGVDLDGQTARFETLRHAGGEGANQWYHVTLREGRYREVRRLWESQGLVVSRLTRVRFGDLPLPRSLKAGRWQELEEGEVSALMRAVDLANEREAGTRARGARPVERPGRRQAKDSAQDPGRRDKPRAQPSPRAANASQDARGPSGGGARSRRVARRRTT